MEKIELEYQETKEGFLQPVIEVSDNQNLDIGKYGGMALNYLKEEYPYRYSLLRAEGKLIEIMYGVNQEAHKRLQFLQQQMLKTNPIPNTHNFYESYRHREMIRTQAEEIILHEIVYKSK